MNITFKRIILWTLVLLTMFIIFLFSAQKGTDSAKLSDKVMSVIEENSQPDKTFSEIEPNPIQPTSSNLSSEQQDRLFQIKVLRKSAHILIFATLGFFLMGAIYTYRIKLSLQIMLSTVLGLLYAASDEWHQTFVDGRTGRLLDVGIDFIGVSLGILFMLLTIRLYNKIKSKKASAD